MLRTKGIKYMFCYSTEEIAGLLNVSEKTIRNWRSDGLKTIDDKQPYLIRGLDLIEFIKKKNSKSKKPTEFNEMFCLSCKEARTAYKREVKLEQQSKMIVAWALCSECKTKMRKPYKIEAFSDLKKNFTLVDELRLCDSKKASSNFQINDKKENANSEPIQGGLFDEYID
ncbi:MAG: helix-turn-helix domain-containing protein [Alphaproteobacteria bacterium]|nr:helix-turn-helix domain-containing protein [Alphaproteobacteria bacterium]